MRIMTLAAVAALSLTAAACQKPAEKAAGGLKATAESAGGQHRGQHGGHRRSAAAAAPTPDAAKADANAATGRSKTAAAHADKAADAQKRAPIRSRAKK